MPAAAGTVLPIPFDYPISPGAADRSVDLLGVRVHRLQADEALATAESFIRSGRPHRIVTANLDFLRLAHEDASFRDCLNSADLVLADGMPLLWASHLARRPIPARITGVDLTPQLASLAERAGFSMFLLGARPGVAAAAAGALQLRHPALHIAGVHSPPFGPRSANDDAAMVEAVRKARPDILLVALGAPAQDLWIASHLEELDVPLAMGVGCTLDVIAGSRRRAPGLMRSAGLEWLFRLASQPGYLWRRYLVHDLPVFARLALSSALSSHSSYQAPQESRA